MNFTDRLAHAWNAFNGRDPTPNRFYASTSSYRPDRMRFSRGNERSIVTAVYNRMAIDVASITIQQYLPSDFQIYQLFHSNFRFHSSQFLRNFHFCSIHQLRLY